MLSGRVEGNYLKRDEEKTLFLKREEGETGRGGGVRNVIAASFSFWVPDCW